LKNVLKNNRNIENNNEGDEEEERVKSRKGK
jgi:hypothetical protein